MIAILVLVWVPYTRKGMSRKEQARIYRLLYGYNSSSKYGKYHYGWAGLPDSIPSIRYGDGKNKIMDFLDKNNASCRMWKVIPEEDEIKKLHSA